MRAALEAAESRRAEIAAMKQRTEEWLETGTVSAVGQRPAEVNPDR